MALALLIVIVACGGSDSSSDTQRSPGPTGAIETTETMPPEPSGEIDVDLCVNVSSLEQRLAGLVAVELRLPNRVLLEIELGKVQAAFSELRQADLGELEEQLEDRLLRLGYRLGELELAVEDFRTNPRPRRAAPHVERDAATFGDALAAFSILARC